MSTRNNIIVVSDFHLASGERAGDGREDGRADDSAFASFLEDVRARAAQKERRWHLVLLGDVFDFPRLAPAVDTSDATARAKLRRIRDCHPEFFRALSRYAAAGLPIHFVPGNHDIQLLRQPVQEELERLVSSAGGALPVRWITFHPWIFYEPGLLYAEHGQQYHYINTFSRLLEPAGGEPGPAIGLPIGAYLDLQHQLRAGHRAVRLCGPAGAEVGRGGSGDRRRPAQGPRGPVWLAWRLAAGLLRMANPAEALRKRDYQRRVLPRYARDLGLGEEQLAAIDELGRPTLPRLAQYLLRAVLRRPQQGRALSRHLRGMAQALDRELAAGGGRVPFYVFGHTHEAGIASMGRDSSGPWYVNSGSWPGQGPSERQGEDASRSCPFVEIAADQATGVKTARLLVWRGPVGGRELVAEVRMDAGSRVSASAARLPSALAAVGAPDRQGLG